MVENQGRATAASAANWWLDVIGASGALAVCAEAFRQHFVAASLAEWERQENARPGSWPEDQRIKITFDRRPGFFLSIVLCATQGHAEMCDPGLNATMTLAATGYQVERWANDQNRYMRAEAEGAL